jgi:hypothetical protein
MVLAAVSCRALIEKDARKAGAEKLRQDVRRWLETIGAAGELEPAEAELISTPLGSLDKTTTWNAGWQSEGMVVLAWALGCAMLPPVHAECEPNDVANAMGFLDERENTPLHCPRLRDGAEIERWADTYLTLHWRLRLSREPGPMDFVKYVSACTWGPLRVDELEIQDNDLAIKGVRIDRLDHLAHRHVLSITQERHQAFNWLLGLESVYSQVTTDT